MSWADALALLHAKMLAEGQSMKIEDTRSFTDPETGERCDEIRALDTMDGARMRVVICGEGENRRVAVLEICYPDGRCERYG